MNEAVALAVNSQMKQAAVRTVTVSHVTQGVTRRKRGGGSNEVQQKSIPREELTSKGEEVTINIISRLSVCLFSKKDGAVPRLRDRSETWPYSLL